MTITAALLSATPLRLLYQLTRDTGVGSTFNLPNAGGVSPDLRTDALAGATGGPMSGAGGSPMLAIMRARLDGFGPLPAAALTQAQARALLQSDDPTRVVLVSRYIGRCVCRITSRGATAAADMNTQWLVDANVDGDGDPILNIGAETGGVTAEIAILEIIFRHMEMRL
jgi:hypothetical protein